MTDEHAVAILAELRAIRAALEGGRAAPDAVTVAALRAIRASVGDRVFTASDLAQHAALPAAGLRTALHAVVRVPSARSLGRLLRRIEGADHAGLVVRRVGVDRDGILWRIEALASFASFDTAFTVAAGDTRAASSGFPSRTR